MLKNLLFAMYNEMFLVHGLLLNRSDKLVILFQVRYFCIVELLVLR